MMPLAAYLAKGIHVGLGSDVAAGPDLSIFGAMRVGAVVQRVLELTGRADRAGALRPLDWLRLGTLEAAHTLGLQNRIGSLEQGKEADLIAIDPRFTTPIPGDPPPDAADELASRLIFRPHPNMVRAAWVRGKRLATS
jgi:cytosine/adenosine deaminase-related metal-dependent hydrolase